MLNRILGNRKRETSIDGAVISPIMRIEVTEEFYFYAKQYACLAATNRFYEEPRIIFDVTEVLKDYWFMKNGLRDRTGFHELLTSVLKEAKDCDINLVMFTIYRKDENDE